MANARNFLPFLPGAINAHKSPFMLAQGETFGLPWIEVMNLLDHECFPETICEVVMQGREWGACLFSWWCDGRSDDAEEDKSYANAKEIARKALNGQLKDRTCGALYFRQRNVNPGWSEQYIKTVEVGEHIFYKPHGGTAKSAAMHSAGFVCVP